MLDSISFSPPQSPSLPVVVIGAGPIGLAAAAHLLQRGLLPLVLEAGPAVGSSVRAWDHVRLFSPWRYLVDPVSRSLLERSGWTMPDPDALPTGAELVSRYLEPLAALPELRARLRLGARVVAVARQGRDRMHSTDRESAPFAVRVRNASGDEQELLAGAVIDASGTYLSPNPLGANGLPALGEAALADRIDYGIPDVMGRDRERYQGSRVLVVGGGHSAFNVLLDLAALRDQDPATQIVWVVRRADAGARFGGGERDALPARGALGQRTRELIEQEQIRFAPLRIRSLERRAEGIVVSGEGRALAPVDRIVAATGFRPDLEPLREMRLNLDPITEAPLALGPLIDPNVHSCGSVPPHGEQELRHPEPGLYLVGMKSYGRAPTFLLLTGYEQVRSVAAALAGDEQAARQVELRLPETGVCSTNRGVEAVAAAVVSAPLDSALPVLSGASVSVCCG